MSALHLSQSESFQSLGAFWSFHIKYLFANKSKFCFNCKYAQILFSSQSKFFFNYKIVQILFNCSLVQGATQAGPSPGVITPLVQKHTWQPIKGHSLYQSERSHTIHTTSQTLNHFLSLFSQIKVTKTQKVQEQFRKP